ncbi:MAG TPA: pitrilysin family protein [Chloroflexota bacterium]|nr:pitrilysin family protein [Chloroflexota bacterium]
MHEDSAFRSTRLDSGVEVVGQLMGGVESAAVGILVGVGARNEEPPHFGISHFTEQMLFRGTRSLSDRELSDRLDALGVDYDSSAGIEMTLVSGVLLGSKLDRGIRLLADVIGEPAFPEDAMESVRTLLLQEIRQREDRPAQLVLDRLRRDCFAGSPLSHDVLGSEESLQLISREDLLAFWRAHYRGGNVTVSVAGNFRWEDVVGWLEEITGSWQAAVTPDRFDPPAFHSGVSATVRDTSQEHLGFAFPGVAFSDPDYYSSAVLAQALGGGTNSRIHQEVREKRGLAYAAHARFDALQRTGLFRVYVGTSAERAHESVEVVFDELRKLETQSLTVEETNLAKNRLKSSVVMRSESSAARMGANLRNWWFEHRLRSLEDVKAGIEAVDPDQVRSLIRRLDISRNIAAVALGPRTQEELFSGATARL